ncbi:hypothetical protein ZIOFF_015230 [Zingiber officinale]|uniref:Uncharacterized protein n=1 Tax=Zingiber officinale TaxID=94328 RepID=A0A8J5HCQ3_ZINOF|nr:hypothetical protein ZIOFF_015230 [Zingiber officinale]
MLLLSLLNSPPDSNSKPLGFCKIYKSFMPDDAWENMAAGGSGEQSPCGNHMKISTFGSASDQSFEV